MGAMVMTLIAALAWIALTFELLGNWIIGNKIRYGFLVKLVGHAAWLAVGIASAIHGLAISAVLCGMVSIRNYLKWWINRV